MLLSDPMELTCASVPVYDTERWDGNGRPIHDIHISCVSQESLLPLHLDDGRDSYASSYGVTMHYTNTLTDDDCETHTLHDITLTTEERVTFDDTDKYATQSSYHATVPLILNNYIFARQCGVTEPQTLHPNARTNIKICVIILIVVILIASAGVVIAAVHTRVTVTQQVPWIDLEHQMTIHNTPFGVSAIP